jgi:hypothetical protein
MSGAQGLRLIAGDAAADAAPTVFVRTASAPPGAPWDQVRSVALEARIGAPLPLDAVLIEQRRLGRWAFGRPARFVVCYVRRADVVGEFRAQAEVDGRSLVIVFRPPAARVRLAKRWGMIAAVGGLAMVLGIGAVASALSSRGETEAQLESLEQRADVGLRQAEAQARLSDQARRLDAVGAGRQTVSTLLGDLAWASSAKAPSAHIDALHWEHGYMGVEVRGLVAPFAQTNRPVIKADKPIRPGVWLWGVGPAAAGPRAPGGSATLSK